MTHQEILGVGPKATQDQIRSAYRKLVLVHHPDAGGNPERFMQIQAAYEALTKKGSSSRTGTCQESVEDIFQKVHERVHDFEREAQERAKRNQEAAETFNTGFKGGNPYGNNFGSPFGDMFDSMRYVTGNKVGFQHTYTNHGDAMYWRTVNAREFHNHVRLIAKNGRVLQEKLIELKFAIEKSEEAARKFLSENPRLAEFLLGR